MGFTDFLQRGEEDSSSGKMLRFLTITALVAAATASHMLAKKIHKDMLVMNSMTACWGKGNMLAFKVGMKKAMETCMNENHSGLLKPANPLLALLSQNADTLPFPTNNNPFLSSSNQPEPIQELKCEPWRLEQALEQQKQEAGRGTSSANRGGLQGVPDGL